MTQADIFYAGGSRGPLARADGRGGLLARGHWFRLDGKLYGPFATVPKAYAALLDTGAA